MIQNISNPRKASRDMRRPAAAEGAAALTGGFVSTIDVNSLPFEDLKVPSHPPAIVSVLSAECLLKVSLFGKDNLVVNGDYESAHQKQK